jgi:hypothetical protein
MFFLDCEASSLHETASYPIEVAWGHVTTGIVRSYLINPAAIPEWTDWDPAAQAVHGLSREYLAEHGEHPRVVAEALAKDLRGQAVYATSHVDREWVDRLTDRTLGETVTIDWMDGTYFLLKLASQWGEALQAARDIAWERLYAEGVYPHRAANDVRHLMEVRRILLGA